jgi:hypothetical protein
MGIGILRELRRAAALSACVAAVGARAGGQTLLFQRDGAAAGDQLGASVAFVGDVDADGFEDLAAGAPGDDVGGTNAGMARVYSGRTLLPLHTWRGGAAQQRLGQAIAGAGDLDGDGHAEVIVGAPGAARAIVFSGATGTPLLTLLGGAGSGFGHAVAGGGQLDGDGVPDLLVGAPYDSTAGTWGGAVRAFGGATGAPIRSHLGGGSYDGFGFAVAFRGDVDGDGRTEYACGAPANWFAGPASYVRAFDGASGAQSWQDSANWNDQYGWSVAGIADLSGDGLPDLLAGAPQDPGVGCACNGKGFVRVLDGASGALVRQVGGTSFYAGLGYDVAAVGDLDGDGWEDFAASQPATEGCGGNTQPVQLRSGASGALLLALPAPLPPGSLFGAALASGDANGDGLRDLVCGAPCADPNGAQSGAFYAYTVVRSVVAYCQAEVNSLGCTPAIAGIGTPSASLAAAFDVRATNVLNNKAGLLFYGYRPRQTPFQGGHMCIVAPTVRTPLQNSGGNPPPDDCSGVFSLDFNARIQSGVDPLLVAGEEVFAQVWSRDPADPSTTNLTDALAFYVHP